MIISIAGTPGSGKSTVAKILSKKLRIKRYYMGGLMREASKKRGITLQKYLAICDKDSKIDREVDEYQRRLGKTSDNFIIEGRTSYHFIPHSYKIFLDVDKKEAAKRIFKELKNSKNKRNEGTPKNEKEVLIGINKRMSDEKKRYKKYYNINPYDKKNFDLIIDTTNITAQQAAKKILHMIKNPKFYK